MNLFDRIALWLYSWQRRRHESWLKASRVTYTWPRQ